MRIFVVIFGIALIVLVAQDAFETIVLLRRVTRRIRLARLFYYQAFSRRELRISLLDSRAGSPPTAVELLRRNCVGKTVEELRMLLHDWEVWGADILERQLSYPLLTFYRSQHDQPSWVEALAVILDTSGLIPTAI